MYTGKGRADHEAIIREALRRELEAFKPPSAGNAWTGIQTAVAQEKKSLTTVSARSFSWRRLAAAAALVFLFAGGGLVLSRSGVLTTPDLSKGSFARLDRECGEAADMASEEEALPLTLHSGFTLEAAGAGNHFQTEDHYPAAVYRRGDEKLLWAGHSSASTDLREFVAELGKQLGVEIKIRDEIADEERQTSLIEFTAGGRSGIAWLDAEGAQALLTLSGSPDLHYLWDAGDEPFRPMK